MHMPTARPHTPPRIAPPRRIVCVATLLLIGLSLAPRAFAAAFTPGNLLLITQATNADFVPRLVELTPAGAIVQTFAVPPVGDTPPRDLVVDGLGRAHVFNGTFTPYLSTLDPATGTWQNNTYDGWSIINNVTYGGIGAIGSQLFVTDQATFGPGQLPSGIVRFDINSFAATRFATGSDYIDLTIGENGLLYALFPSGSPGGTAADVWDPSTLTKIRTILLPSGQGLRALAVDATGTIYAVGLNTGVYKYSSTGALIAHVDTNTLTGRFDYLEDIDLGPGGKLAIASDCGGFGVCDVSLDPQTMHYTQFPWCWSVWVTFLPPAVTPVTRTSWGQLKTLYR